FAVLSQYGTAWHQLHICLCHQLPCYSFRFLINLELVLNYQRTVIRFLEGSLSSSQHPSKNRRKVKASLWLFPLLKVYQWSECSVHVQRIIDGERAMAIIVFGQQGPSLTGLAIRPKDKASDFKFIITLISWINHPTNSIQLPDKGARVHISMADSSPSSFAAKVIVVFCIP